MKAKNSVCIVKTLLLVTCSHLRSWTTVFQAVCVGVMWHDGTYVGQILHLSV